MPEPVAPSAPSGVFAQAIHGGHQIAVVHGDVNYYEVRSQEPDEKFRVGLRCLFAGKLTQARALLSDAVMSGYRADGAAYYWALSLCADRSFQDLSPEDQGCLSRALSLDAPTEDWSRAQRALSSMLNHAASRLLGKAVATEWMVLEKQIEAELPAERIEEINRFLIAVKSGIGDGEWERSEAEEIDRHRWDNDRRRRVPLFFIADPVAPVEEVVPNPHVPFGRWLVVAVGGFLVLAGMVNVFTNAVPEAGSALLIMLAGWAVGTAVGVRPLLGWLWHERSRILTIQIRRLTPSGWRPQDVVSELVQWRGGVSDKEHGFLAELADAVESTFSSGTRVGGSASRHYTASAVRSMARAYIDDQPTPEGLLWLITWHAREAEALHRRVSRRRQRFPLIGRFRAVAGTFVLGAATLFGLLFLGAFLGMTALIVGALLLYSAMLPIWYARRQYRMECDAAADRYRRQQVEYQRILDILEDRPTDAEMARWLDFDKRDFYLDSLRRTEASDRDVIDRFVLLEANGNCPSARLPEGPPRYARYKVRLFLLTDGGIRCFYEELNFVTGDWRNAERTSLPYDAISSVVTTEDRIRSGSTVRLLNGTPVRRIGSDRWRKTTLKINLVATDSIEVIVRKFDSDAEMIENFDTELESAGIPKTVRILESIAAEGRAWLTRYQERRLPSCHDLLASSGSTRSDDGTFASAR